MSLLNLFGFRSAKSAARTPAAARLRLEGLEDRAVPALVTFPQVSGGLMMVETDGYFDNTRIVDHGSGNVTLTVNGAQFNMVGVREISIRDYGYCNVTYGLASANQTARSVQRVYFSGGLGEDSLTVNLGASLTSAQPMVVDFRDNVGHDSLTVNAGRVGVNGRLNVNFDGGLSDDTMKVNLSGAAAGASIGVTAMGREGNDTLGVAMGAGAVYDRSSVDILMEAHRGWDVVSVNGWTGGTTMLANSRLNVRLAGNTLADVNDAGDAGCNVSFHYLGRMDGTITFDIAGSGGTGQSGNDWVSARTWFNGESRGTVGNGLASGARIRAGAGDDAVDASFSGQNAVTLISPVIVDGGAGFDTLHRSRVHTSQFLLATNEIDRVVPVDG